MSTEVQKAAEVLVDRARVGDQNAMAILSEIAKNRQAGNSKAGLAYDYAMTYIKKRPTREVRPAFGHWTEPVSFGALAQAKKENAYGRTVVRFILDLGPSAYNSRLCAHILANLRPVDRGALRQVLSNTPPDARRVFGGAYRNPRAAIGEARKNKTLTETEVKALQLGYILGMARTIQEIRDNPDAPVSPYSPNIGWELGE